jgi:hypothetical protein
LHSGLSHLSHTCNTFCSGYSGDGGLENYLTGLASNHDPPNLSLPSSWDYRREITVPGKDYYNDWEMCSQNFVSRRCTWETQEALSVGCHLLPKIATAECDDL